MCFVSVCQDFTQELSVQEMHVEDLMICFMLALNSTICLWLGFVMLSLSMLY